MSEENNENQVELDTNDAQETEVEVGGVSAEAGSDKDSDDRGHQEDEFSKAENATQKRIDRLTKKMREAERRETEALNYARQVQAEAEKVKQRMNSLDSSYVNEYTNRIKTQTETAEAALARAVELGDSKAVVEAQRQLTNLAIESDRARQAKVQQERYQQQVQAQQQAQVRQPMPQQQPKRPDKKAEQWAMRNEWFGQDEAMTYAAFGIHKKLVEDEGFDPTSDEYYNELDKRISNKFGNANGGNKRAAQTVASASRNSNSGRSGKKVRLTPSQVAIAKKLGVPLEEYAKYVKEQR